MSNPRVLSATLLEEGHRLASRLAPSLGCRAADMYEAGYLKHRWRLPFLYDCEILKDGSCRYRPAKAGREDMPSVAEARQWWKEKKTAEPSQVHRCTRALSEVVAVRRCAATIGARLFGPDPTVPWGHQLREIVRGEITEAVEAVTLGPPDKVIDEMGDVLMCLMMLAMCRSQYWPRPDPIDIRTPLAIAKWRQHTLEDQVRVESATGPSRGKLPVDPTHRGLCEKTAPPYQPRSLPPRLVAFARWRSLAPRSRPPKTPRHPTLAQCMRCDGKLGLHV